MNYPLILLSSAGIGLGALLGLRRAEPAPINKTAQTAPPQAVPPKPAPASDVIKGSLSSTGLVDLLAYLETATCAQVWAEIGQYSKKGQAARQLASQIWPKFSAEERFAAITAGVANYSSSETSKLKRLTFVEMAAKDPEAVIKALPKSGIRQEDQADVFEAALPAMGFEKTLALVGKEDVRAVTALFTALAATDGAKAAAECTKLPDGKLKNSVLSGVATKMAALQPIPEVFAWMLTQYNLKSEETSHGMDGSPLHAFLKQMQAKDPAAVAKLILDNQTALTGTYTSYQTRNLLKQWIQKDPAAAEAWNANNPLGDNLQSQFEVDVDVHKLGQLAGADAVAFYSKLPDSSKPEAAAALVAKLPLSELPGGVEAFLSSIPDGRRHSLIQALVNKVSSGPVQDFAKYVGVLTKAGAKDYQLQSLTAKLSPNDLPQNAERNFKKATELAETGDAQAAIALAGIPDAKARADVDFAKLAVKIAEEDPDAAAKWIISLPGSPNKDSMMTNLAANWVKADPEAVTEWFQGLPTGKGRDMVAGELANASNLTGDTATALHLAKSIGDAALQTSTYAAALADIHLTDPAKAEALLNQQGLPPASVAKILERIKKQQ